jgi:HTH-type transcriptional regulator/antitoxin HipB
VCRMRIRTATDLGAFIRERRTKLGMDQISLAKKAATSRKWLVEVEQGKPGAEIGLILRTLKSLEISIDVVADSPVETPSQGKAKAQDINSILDSLKKRPLKKQI